MHCPVKTTIHHSKTLTFYILLGALTLNEAQWCVCVFQQNAQHTGATCTNILNYYYFSIRIQTAHSAIYFMNFFKILTFSYILQCKLNTLPDKLCTTTAASQFNICCLRYSWQRWFTLDILQNATEGTDRNYDFWVELYYNLHKVNDSYFNAGIKKPAVLLNFRDIWTYKNIIAIAMTLTLQNSCRYYNAARCRCIQKIPKGTQ